MFFTFVVPIFLTGITFPSKMYIGIVLFSNNSMICLKKHLKIFSVTDLYL